MNWTDAPKFMLRKYDIEIAALRPSAPFVKLQRDVDHWICLVVCGSDVANRYANRRRPSHERVTEASIRAFDAVQSQAEFDDLLNAERLR